MAVVWSSTGTVCRWRRRDSDHTLWLLVALWPAAAELGQLLPGPWARRSLSLALTILRNHWVSETRRTSYVTRGCRIHSDTKIDRGRHRPRAELPVGWRVGSEKQSQRNATITTRRILGTRKRTCQCVAFFFCCNYFNASHYCSDSINL